MNNSYSLFGRLFARFSQALTSCLLLLTTLFALDVQAQVTVTLSDVKVSGCYLNPAGTSSLATVRFLANWTGINGNNSSTTTNPRYLRVSVGASSKVILLGTGAYTQNSFTSDQVVVSPQEFSFQVPLTALPGSATVTAQLGTLNFTSTFVPVTGLTSSSVVATPVACPATPCGNGNLGGIVFNDFNADGSRNTITASGVTSGETQGVGGVTVTVYTNTGTTFTTTTDVYGRYTFTQALTYPVRVEFTGIPAEYEASSTPSLAISRSTTQFITAASATTANCNVSLGVNTAADYCNTSPQLFVPCYTNGNATGASGTARFQPALVSVPFNAAGNGFVNLETNWANSNQIGSTWGVAYNRETKRMFTSAVLRRHVGYGTAGIGGIYVTNLSSTSVASTTANTVAFVDLDAAPFSIALTSNNLADNTSNRDLPLNRAGGVEVASRDAAAFANVGMEGLGDIDISDDGNTLYVLDTKNKQVISLDITAFNASGNIADRPTTFAATAITNPGCVLGQWRPWALKYRKGKLYIGGICDASSTTLTTGNWSTAVHTARSNLKAVVYEYDFVNPMTAVLDFPLAYPRGYALGTTTNNGSGFQAVDLTGWYPWTNDWAILDKGVTNNNKRGIVYPQPMLSDIEFDTDGSMLLGLGDRTGFQTGTQNISPAGTGSIPAGSTLYDGYSGGDFLKGFARNGIFILESNGVAGPFDGFGNNNNQGPGFGEFFNDDWQFSGTFYHAEVALGGLAIRQGSGQTVAVTIDPEDDTPFAAGFRLMNNNTGLRDAAFTVYTSTNTGNPGDLGKAAGLGDVELTCDIPRYLQIGNRAWFDRDADGVQDPGEPALAGLSAKLYSATAVSLASPIATTTTGANGEYFFNNLLPNTNYVIVFGDGQQVSGQPQRLLLSSVNYEVTLPNMGEGAAPNLDLNDSDASLQTAAGTFANKITIPVRTGDYTADNHTLDIGLTCILPIVPALTTTPATCNGTVAQNNGLLTIPASVTNANRYSVVSGTVTTGFAYSTATTMPTTFPANIISNAPNAGATYTVRFYNGGNDCYVDEVVVVAPNSCTAPICNLTATAQASSQTICVNQSVTVFATVSPTGSYTYNWAGPAGAIITGSGSTTATVSGLSTVGVNTFTVTVSSSPSCSTTATVSVTVQELQLRATIFSSGASSATFCQGTQAPALANYIDAGDTDTPVQWYGPSSSTGTLGPLIPGATNSTYAPVGSETLAVGTYYYAVVASGQACTATAFVQVISQNCTTPCVLPTISLVNGSQSVCVDGTAPRPMSASLVSGTATAYQWYGPSSSTATVLNTPILGETNDTYITSMSSGDVAGTFNYAVVVQNGPASCTTVAYGTVVVSNRPDLVQLPTALCAGESIDILSSFSVANGPTSQIRIYRTLEDQTAGVNSLTNTVVSLTATTTFYVSMTNAAGCSWLDETNIVVNPLPNAGSDQSLSCVAGVAPTTTNLVATSATGGVWSAAGGNPTATSFGSTSALTTTVSGLNAPGSYTFVFTTPSSCSDAVVVTVPVCQTVCTQPVVSIASGATQTVCVGTASAPIVGSIVSGTAVSYQWFGPSSTSTSAGALIGGANSLSYSVPASLSVGTYYYTLLASTASGSTCSGSAVAMLTVSPNPAFTVISTTVCSGTPQFFTSFVQTEPNTTYSVHATLADAEANANRLNPQQSFSISTGTIYYIRGRETNSNCISIQSLTLTPIDCTVPQASLGDKVFVDNNKNGIQDAGDTPLAGVTVTLISNGTVVATTTTLNSGTGIGCYSFTGLTPGVPYSVSFTTPANYTATTPNSGTNDAADSDPVNGITAPVTLTAGENNPTLDAGFIPLKASLGDYVWLDTDKNGQQDPTESGVQNVTVVLCDATSGSAISTTLTDSQGKYLFDNLDPSSYTVKFTAPDGTTFTTPNSGTDATDSDVASLTGQRGSTGVYSLSAGEQNLTVDAGLVPLLGSIGDFVWKDANRNGIQDDGPNSGIGNVTVNLLRETTPGQFTVVATTITSTSGLYSFTGLAAGNYVVRVDLATVPFYCEPTTQTVVTPNDATNSKIDASGTTPVIVINPSNPAQTDYPKADAGFSPVPFGSIGDYVWKDTNNDGIQNDGTTPVAGVGLKLLNSDGFYIIRGTLSGAQESPAVSTSGTGMVYAGFNSITNELVLEVGFNGLSGSVTMAHIHTGVTGTNGPVTIDLVPQGFPIGVQAGNFAASLTLTAAQETLLMSNKLYVNVHTSTNGGGEVRAQLVACEFTNTAGAYLFDKLPEGTYKVAVDTPTLPTTCVVSTMQNSTAATEATDSDFDPATGQSGFVSVIPSDPDYRDIRTVDLALTGPLTGTVGDFVWKDSNNNGQYDAGTEFGSAGVRVNLLEVTSPVGSTAISTSLVSSTTTGTDGAYSFTNVPAGRYVVEIDKTTLPTNCIISPRVRQSGVPDALNSDVDPGTARTPIFEINPADPTTLRALSLDAALVTPDCQPVCLPITVQRVR